MNKTTLNALALFPPQLEAHYAAIPASFKHWAPASWDGIPSERFTAIEQLCHVRDVEVDGYHVRFERTLQEANPYLPDLGGEALAVERNYAIADASEVLASFREARATTIDIIAGLDAGQLARPAVFEDYGPVTLRSLVHYLCSHDQQHLAGLQWLLGKIEAARVAAAR
ncbi:MAG: DinB family protein [Gammaproteobacteria bacterium]|nr:DinB family protein [Gammaproteobacteria bacterium]